MKWLDRFIASRKKGSLERENTEWKKKTIKGKGKEKTIIFLGWGLPIEKAEGLYARFKETIIIYQIPDSLISHNPHKARKSFLEVINDAKKVVKKENITKVYGLSLGSSIALYIANRFKKIKKVILALTGDKISDALFESPISTLIVRKAKKAGFTKEDFSKELKEFDPVNNLNHLKGKEIRILLAKGDGVVPYTHGLKLAKAMKKRKLNYVFRSLSVFGHFIGAIKSFYLTNKEFYE